MTSFLDRSCVCVYKLNYMVQYSKVDKTFAALSDPTRQLILNRLGEGSATISELVEPAGMSLTGLKKYVAISGIPFDTETRRHGETQNWCSPCLCVSVSKVS